MVDYEKAFKKPFTNLTKLVIGIVLSVIPVVSWLAKGFAIESSGLGKTKASDKMPNWEGWGNLFVKGLLSDVITLVYIIPAVVVIALGISAAIIPLVSTFSSSGMAGMMSGGWMSLMPMVFTTAPLAIIGVIILLLGVYLAPLAVLNYVKKKSFSAAFDLKTISKKAFTSEYFIAWLITLVLAVVLGVVLSIVPLVGTALASFIVLVISYSLFGQIFK